MDQEHTQSTTPSFTAGTATSAALSYTSSQTPTVVQRTPFRKGISFGALSYIFSVFFRFCSLCIGIATMSFALEYHGLFCPRMRPMCLFMDWMIDLAVRDELQTMSGCYLLTSPGLELGCVLHCVGCFHHRGMLCSKLQRTCRHKYPAACSVHLGWLDNYILCVGDGSSWSCNGLEGPCAE